MRDEKFIRIHQNPFIAYIVSHEDKMWEYMTFGPYITYFVNLHCEEIRHIFLGFDGNAPLACLLQRF